MAPATTRTPIQYTGETLPRPPFKSEGARSPESTRAGRPKRAAAFLSQSSESGHPAAACEKSEISKKEMDLEHECFLASQMAQWAQGRDL